MNRTAELLEIAQEWKNIATKTVIPAVREACLYQRVKALTELAERTNHQHNHPF